MRIPAAYAVACVCLSVPAAFATMQDALLASHMLTDVAESRVVQLDQPRTAGGPAQPPIYGVVFTFEGSCWLYAAEFGSRILGPANATWDTSESISARLKAFGLPIANVTLYPRTTPPRWLGEQVRLNNACVIGALSALARLQDPAPLRSAGLVLLSYHLPAEAPANAMFVDHCLLVYRAREEWLCVDPRQPQRPFALGRVQLGAPLDPALVELSLKTRYPLKSARLLPIAPDTLAQITQSALWRDFRLERGPLD